MPKDIFTLSGMLLAVALVLLLAWLVTRYLAGRGLAGAMPARGARHMKLLEQLPLSRDQRLALVQIGERYFVLGISPAGISRLAELSGEEAADWAKNNVSGDTSRPPAAGFRDLLQETLNRKRK